jgi:hypothetical protein
MNIHTSTSSNRLPPTASYEANRLKRIHRKVKNVPTAILPMMGWITVAVSRYEEETQLKDDLISNASPILATEVATIVDSASQDKVLHFHCQ